jgi:TolB-like protein
MSFFRELRRRNVIRVAATYLALAWLVVQIVETLFPMFGVSDATARIVVVALAIGFIPVLVLSWAFEWTPEGLKRDSAVDHGSRTAQVSAKRLDRIVIAALVIALTYFVVDELLIETQNPSGIPDDRSIAVLPFVNMSSDPEQEYFADGISEELLNLLARIPELRVISRTSAFAFKGKDIDIPEIARELNVAHILEGSVRKSGNSIRITVQLIQTDSDRHLWSETYERTLDDIFAIQDDVAEHVVDQLEIRLLADMPSTKQVDPLAYERFLQARSITALSNRSQYPAAAELLETALSIEPDYVDALLLFSIISDDPARQATLRQRVLELDPHNATLKAFTAVDEDDAAVAIALLNEAAETDPTSYMVLFNGARIAQRIGQLELAIEIYEYLVARDPLFFWAHLNLADYYVHAGRIEDGLRSYERALELNDQWGAARWKHGLALLINGEPEHARVEFGLEPGDEYRAHGLALAYHDLGRFDESQAMFDVIMVEELAEIWPFGLARAYAWVGDADNTFYFLEESVEQNFLLLGGLGRHPLFYKLHDDPRWMPFLESIGQAPEQLDRLRLEIALPD